jgi:hypothetical protein
MGMRIYLAKTTTPSQFTLIAYIVKPTTNQKGKSPKNGLPLFKNKGFPKCRY